MNPMIHPLLPNSIMLINTGKKKYQKILSRIKKLMNLFEKKKAKKKQKQKKIIKQKKKKQFSIFFFFFFFLIKIN